MADPDFSFGSFKITEYSAEPKHLAIHEWREDERPRERLVRGDVEVCKQRQARAQQTVLGPRGGDKTDAMAGYHSMASSAS